MEIKAATLCEDGAIDCTIKHPVYGWVPYTARYDDPDERGRKIYAIAKAMLDGEAAPDVGDDVLQPPSPEERRRRARRSHQANKLSVVRALRDVGKWAEFQAALALAGADAIEDWSLAVVVSRMDPVFLPVFEGIGMDAAEIDAVFGLSG